MSEHVVSLMRHDVKDSPVHSFALTHCYSIDVIKGKRSTPSWHGLSEEIRSARGINQDEWSLTATEHLTMVASLHERNDVKNMRKWLTTHENQEYLDHE